MDTVRVHCHGRQAVVGRAVFLGLAAALAGLSLSYSPAAQAATAVQYKLHLEVKGVQTAADESKALPQETRHQSSEWTWKPKDVTVWLPKFSGPPGQAYAGAAETYTVDERPILSGIGTVNDHGTFFEVHESTPVAEPFSCAGAIVFVGPMIQRVTVTQLDPTIELETDFKGTLGVTDKGVIGNKFGEPCWKASKGEEGFGYFNYQWDNPKGQRMQVGMLVPQTEIGDPFIGGPAQDYSNVETTEESTQECHWTHPCSKTFKLSGEYDLQKLCEGTDSSGAFACGSGSGSSSGPGSNPGNGPNAPPGGGGNESNGKKAAVTPPVISALRLSPSTFAAARAGASTAERPGAAISYMDSVPGSTATVEIQSRRSGFEGRRGCQAKRPRSSARVKRCSLYTGRGSFARVDAAGDVAFRFTGRIGGRALAAGAYRLAVSARDSAGAGAKAYAAFTIKR